MSRGNNNLKLSAPWTPGLQQRPSNRSLQGDSAWNYVEPPIPMDQYVSGGSGGSQSLQTTQQFPARLGTPADVWPVQRRSTVRTLSLTGFPSGSHPRFSNDDTARETSTRPTFHGHEWPPLHFSGRNLDFHMEDEDPQLINEQEKALKKLKREVYIPKPKTYIRRVSLYYRDMSRSANNSVKDVGKEMEDEDNKKCAICLDDFQPRTEVILTPCNHMFHEDCIVPWVKSNGQCPVCRFTISEKTKGNGSAASSNRQLRVMPDSDLLFRNEVMPILRAAEEAFARVRH